MQASVPFAASRGRRYHIVIAQDHAGVAKSSGKGGESEHPKALIRKTCKPWLWWALEVAMHRVAAPAHRSPSLVGAVRTRPRRRSRKDVDAGRTAGLPWEQATHTLVHEASHRRQP